jgi:Ni,Fe-hydrogenase I cytochrome b subunit
MFTGNLKQKQPSLKSYRLKPIRLKFWLSALFVAISIVTSFYMYYNSKYGPSTVVIQQQLEEIHGHHEKDQFHL